MELSLSILPVGISFYSFQIVGYLVDVYRGDAVAEKNIITYGAYIAFFPQLLSGPIARTKTLLPQFQKSHVFNYDFAVHSLKRFAVGFFEKYFIASKMGAFVDYIYGDINGYSGGVLFGMSIMYTLQIYFDFAGYTNMAIGFAGLFDYKLDENFNSPYLSQSVRDFWARWHMSLTKWLRDYIYIPLGGNRCSRARNSFNVFVTFLISGLWHGANYTFIVWGAIHGLAQVIENLFGVKKYKESKGVLGWIRILVVFLFVNFAWIFFRAPDMTTALHVVAGTFSGITDPLIYVNTTLANVASFGDKKQTLLAFAFILIFAVIEYRKLHNKRVDYISVQKKPIRWACYITIMFMVIFLTSNGATSQFIYYRF